MESEDISHLSPRLQTIGKGDEWAYEYPADFPVIEDDKQPDNSAFPMDRAVLSKILYAYSEMMYDAMAPRSVRTEGKNIVRCIANQMENLAAALETEDEYPHIFPPEATPLAQPTAPDSDNHQHHQDLKNDILSCVKQELANHLSAVNNIKKELIAIQKEQTKTTYATVTSATASALASSTSRNHIPQSTTPNRNTSQPVSPKSLPAIIVTPTTATKTKEEAVTALRKSISFREAKYAPAKVKTISKGKLRVEFDTVEQRDDALNRLRTAERVTAEPARRLSPLIILKGVTCDVPAEELPSIIKSQNPDLEPLINNDTDLLLRFKRNNRNPALYNAVLQASPSVWRRITEMGRVCVDYMRVHAEDFSPFLQCFRCLQFGHTKAKCSSTIQTCGHCASPQHTIADCPSKEDKKKTKCANCEAHNTRFGSKLDTGHRATAPTCPRLKSMRERIGQRIDYGP